MEKSFIAPFSHYTFGFFGSDPKADITVPLVPVALVVNVGWISPDCLAICAAAVAEAAAAAETAPPGAGWSHLDFLQIYFK